MYCHNTVGRQYGFNVPYRQVRYNVHNHPPGSGFATIYKPVQFVTPPRGFGFVRDYQAVPGAVPPGLRPRPQAQAQGQQQQAQAQSQADCALWAARRSYWGVNNMGPVC